jgi:hypothetical protein
MRHALVVTQLVHQARPVPETAGHPRPDAPPDPEPPAAPGNRPRRLATLFRRARALVVRPI